MNKTGATTWKETVINICKLPTFEGLLVGLVVARSQSDKPQKTKTEPTLLEIQFKSLGQRLVAAWEKIPTYNTMVEWVGKKTDETDNAADVMKIGEIGFLCLFLVLIIRRLNDEQIKLLMLKMLNVGAKN